MSEKEEEILKKLALARREGRRKDEADCLSELGLIYRDRDEFQKAADSWQQSIRIYESIRDWGSAALDCRALALVYFYRPNWPYRGLGDPIRAILFQEKAVELSRSDIVKASYLSYLAGMYATLGDLQNAIRCSDLADAYDHRENCDRDESIKWLKQKAQRGYK